MSRKQKKLMASAIQALKPGGRLVYSTCTFAPEENEMIIDWALRKFPNEIVLEDIVFPLTNRMKGLSRWEGELFHPDIKRTARILPTRQMEAFYIARLSKPLR